MDTPITTHSHSTKASAVIELQNLSKTYPSPNGPVVALKNINLSVFEGEIFGIIGPSGAGKSSLIRCVNLLEHPSSGSVKVAGKSLTELTTSQLRESRHHIGMIFQHFNLLASKTVFENIAFPLKLRGINKQVITEKVNTLLEIVELKDKRDAYPSQLSGGQKQRVAIARALAENPKVLLCDEATSALDAKTTESVLALLQKINRQFNLTILLITHQIEVIKSICDRVAVMSQGEIVEQTDTVSLFSQPQTAIGQALIYSYLRQDLPKTLLQRIQHTPKPDHFPLIAISFFGAVVAEPIITSLIRELGVAVNILQANLEYIREQPIGRMVIEIMTPMSESDKVKEVLVYLHNKGLKTEILGYVRINAI